MISKILAGMPADETGELFVGDAIIQVNDISTQGKTHDEVGLHITICFKLALCQMKDDAILAKKEAHNR